MEHPKSAFALRQGQLIKGLRVGPDPKHPNYTLAEAAAAIDVTAATWSRWEHGHITPRDHHKIAIANLFGVAPSLIFALPGNGVQ